MPATQLRRKRSNGQGLKALKYMSPWLLLFLAFEIYPLIYGFYLSLNKVESLKMVGFVGIANYISAFDDPNFIVSLSFAGYIAIWIVAVGYWIALGIALLLNEDFKGKWIARSLIIIPWAIPGVSAGVIWRWLLNASFGAVNGLLWQLGIINDYVAFFSTDWSARHTIIFVLMWQRLPLMIVILLAGLQMVPKELYEAATLDGASMFARFRHMTLPSIRAVTLTLLVLQTMLMLQVFTEVFMLTKGQPANSTLVINYYAFRVGLEYLRMGEGAAMAFILTLVVLVLSIAYVRLWSRER